MSSRSWIVVAVLLLIFGFSLVGPVMSKVEEPGYVIVASDANIEIRYYNSMILAEVMVDGDRKEAIREGFRVIADYIFGNNSSSQKIAMTAPVQQQKAKDGWRVSFVMPSEYSLTSLPKPSGDNLWVREIPSAKYVVIRFSGTSTQANLKKHEAVLLDYVSAHRLKVLGSIKYAFYNPPWTLPFLRRNELMLQLVE